MMRFTKGPWTVEVGDDTTNVESKYYTICTQVSNEDAHLIAEAPMLVKACQDALEASHDPQVERILTDALDKVFQY